MHPLSGGRVCKGVAGEADGRRAMQLLVVVAVRAGEARARAGGSTASAAAPGPGM